MLVIEFVESVALRESWARSTREVRLVDEVSAGAVAAAEEEEEGSPGAMFVPWQ